MGVDLLVRTTRSVKLIDAGRALLAVAGPAFEKIIDPIEGSRAIGKSTTGTLRLTLPRGAYLIVIAPVLGAFQERYPDVCLELSINEQLVDIVKEAFMQAFAQAVRDGHGIGCALRTVIEEDLRTGKLESILDG